jgi:hypothetical protein
MHISTHPMYEYAHKHVHADNYVIIIAIPQQQWFRERASLLHYTYIACLAFTQQRVVYGYLMTVAYIGRNNL